MQAQWLGEQRGKGLLDQLFGQVGSKGNGWIAQYIRQNNIFSCDDVMLALVQGSAKPMSLRPDGPKWICKKIDFPRYHAMQTRYLYAVSLKITRTYRLLAKPHPLPQFPPQVWDCLFADSSVKRLIGDFRVEVCDWEEQVPWRKTFYTGNKEWEAGAPDPKEPHRLKRVWEAQRHCRPPQELFYVRSFEERVAHTKKSHEKKGAALKRRLEVLKGLAGIAAADPSGPAQTSSSPASSSQESSCDDSSSSSDSD